MTIPAALARRRDYAGPALFSYGFRPFFLGGAVWAALGVLLWLPQYFGEITVPTALAPMDWHIHEMLYGYAAAVIAGFLLTAIPNWTGRLPVTGAPLGALALLWLAGRLAMLFSAKIGATPAAIIDSAFLIALAAMAMQEIVAGRNWRNLRVLAVLGVLIAGNIAFHWEAIHDGSAAYGTRLGIAAIVALITLVGGRIVPSFTHNWLVRENPGRLPQPFARYDMATIVVAVAALALWVALPTQPLTGSMLLLAGAMQAGRLMRWAGDRTWRNPLVLILHVGYAFVPIGFLLLGAALLWPAIWPVGAGLHAWTAGAIGIMTLAVMTRATLGHTGQPLVATGGTQAIYALAVLAVLARIAAAFAPSSLLLHLATFAWIGAFGGFAIVFGPLLVRRPPSWAAKT